MKYWTYLSLALASALTCLVYSNGTLNALGGDAHNVVTLFAQISATMLGFLIAALSILASISGHRLLRQMQRLGHYRVLLRRFFINSTAFAAAMVAALVSIVFRDSNPFSTYSAFLLFVFATLLLVDIGYRLWLVMHNLTPSEISNS